MKVIEPYYKNLEMVPLFSQNVDDYRRAIKFIEEKGRICYKSEDKITSSSAGAFVSGMFKSGHHSQIEHSNLVMATIRPSTFPLFERQELRKKISTKFLTITTDSDLIYIGGNLRAWVDATDFDKTKSLAFLVDHIQEVIGKEYQPVTEYKDIPVALHRMGVQIIHDRAFTHELVRHRVMSFSQESQRYCNYGKAKFGGQIEFIRPEKLKGLDNDEYTIWVGSMGAAELCYLELLKKNVLPQIARGVLPNSCKTEIYISGDTSGWDHLEYLRCAPGAHPDMRSMMSAIKQNRKDMTSTYVKDRTTTNNKRGTNEKKSCR